jgi:hypothetical protein
MSTDVSSSVMVPTRGWHECRCCVIDEEVRWEALGEFEWVGQVEQHLVGEIGLACLGRCGDRPSARVALTNRSASDAASAKGARPMSGKSRAQTA